jgi:hypothetical protein
MPEGVYPSNEIKPTRINQCKTTYVVARGRDRGQGATATQARDAALANARAQIALAVAAAQALPCPAVGGCDNACRKGRVVRVGKGIDRNIPVKKADVWVCEAWGFESFEVHCHCT